jgi:hypothetical protein
MQGDEDSTAVRAVPYEPLAWSGEPRLSHGRRRIRLQSGADLAAPRVRSQPEAHQHHYERSSPTIKGTSFRQSSRIAYLSRSREKGIDLYGGFDESRRPHRQFRLLVTTLPYAALSQQYIRWI